MSDDLIVLLRDLACNMHDDLSVADDAADEIARLRAEVERLRTNRDLWKNLCHLDVYDMSESLATVTRERDRLQAIIRCEANSGTCYEVHPADDGSRCTPKNCMTIRALGETEGKQ